MENTFVVIDGNSLINRAFYAIQRPMITKEGIYTQGIYAFLSMLSKIRNDYNPTHMLVAFDRKAPTFRHLEYQEYKAGRKKMPIELAMEMPYLKEILDAMGIARFEIDGFEADDIIGTATRIAEEAGVKSFVITGDRDALQLATDLTSVIINKKGMSEFKLYDDAAMIEEYGFDHIQFIDYKALRGDTSDNIPGIPKVGEKTATALIQQFGSLENLLSNLDQVENVKLRERIEENAMSAMMSKRLATIIRTVPMEMSFDDFVIKKQNTKALVELYTKLEFKTFLNKLLENADDLSEDEGSIEYSIPEIKVISSENDLSDGPDFSNPIILDFDCDDNHVGKPVLYNLQILDASGKAFLIMLPDMLAFLRNNLKDWKLEGFNLGRFYYYLASNGIDTDLAETIFDASVAQYVLTPTSKETKFEEIILETFHEIISDEEVQISLFNSVNNTEKYAKKLALLDLLIKKQENEIETADLHEVYYNIELPLVKVLAEMEAVGFRTDKNALSAYGDMLKSHIAELQESIFELVGESFNLNSPKQLGEVLFEKLGLPAGKKTAKGYSTSAEILEKLAPDFPVVAKILEYRMYNKLNGTYVDGMLPLISDDGKIHAHFMQTITATGRISCTEPNLQNIPVRNELGRQLRKVFTASAPDRVLIGADYSQIELRVLAHMSQDSTLISAFNEGHDIHKETASKVFGVPLDEVTSQQRSNAKAVNFGVIYGMSQYGLSTELTISRKKAEKYINDYFERFKSVKDFMNKCVEDCRSSGESRTMFGRRRIVPEISASQYMVRQLGERLAMNTPIQGSAADIIKLAMIRVRNELKEKCPDAKLILQIHDELIIDASSEDADLVQDILKQSMMNAAELSVKLELSQNTAYNWFDLK